MLSHIAHLVELIEQELCEGAFVGHELLVVADLRDFAVPHHHDLVHLGQEADGVGHQDPGLLLQKTLKLFCSNYEINEHSIFTSLLSYVSLPYLQCP